MSRVLEIRIYPDKVLKEKAEKVETFDGELRDIVESMFETMYKRGGVGLAANQVGILKRIVVIDIHSGKELQGREKLVLINPEIIHLEGEEVKEEGCLSLPGLYRKVKRAAFVKVRAQNVEGEEFEVEGEELLARALQHEIDHLDGIVFIDRLPPISRRLALEKYRKLRKAHERKQKAKV